MMSKMRKVVEEENIPINIDIDYENFMSEMEANVDLQYDFMGKPLKYGGKFQLVQESSKRFLSIHESKNSAVKQIFNDRYIDSYCFYFGFSEYPSRFTHFFIKECSNFQREGSGTVKDDHYFYLCAIYNSKTLYAYSVRKYLIMTQSYSTPITYNLIRESDTFDEIEDVQSSEVVLLTYANDTFYLNVPHSLDKESGEYEEQNLIFQNWQDYKDVDFNGWFMVEYDEDNNKVRLKHFNTGKYMIIENGEDIGDDYAALSEERGPESEIIFEPINTDTKNIIHYTTDTVFKIRAYSMGENQEKNYLRFANEEDLKQLSGNKKDNVFGDSANETVPIVVKDSCPINKFDTFNLVFPKDDTYRELVFCKDTYLHLETFLTILNNSENILNELETMSNGLYKTFNNIY